MSYKSPENELLRISELKNKEREKLLERVLGLAWEQDLRKGRIPFPGAIVEIGLGNKKNPYRIIYAPPEGVDPENYSFRRIGDVDIEFVKKANDQVVGTAGIHYLTPAEADLLMNHPLIQIYLTRRKDS